MGLREHGDRGRAQLGDPVQHLVVHGFQVVGDPLPDFTCRSTMADRTRTKTRRALPPQRAQIPIVAFSPISPVGSSKNFPKNRKRRAHGRAFDLMRLDGIRPRSISAIRRRSSCATPASRPAATKGALPGMNTASMRDPALLAEGRERSAADRAHAWTSARPARSDSSCARLTRASRLAWHGSAQPIEMAGTSQDKPGHDDSGSISPGRAVVCGSVLAERGRGRPLCRDIVEPRRARRNGGNEANDGCRDVDRGHCAGPFPHQDLVGSRQIQALEINRLPHRESPCCRWHRVALVPTIVL
jgi:hypothetical protein